MDQPTIDVLTYGTHLKLNKLNLKVVFSGLGGDELFLAKSF